MSGRMSGRRGRHFAAAMACGVAAVAGAADTGLGYSPGNMDRQVSARRDFYRYAVGGWLDRTEIPPSEPDVGGFTQLATNLDARLLRLIRDAAAAPAAPGTPEQLVGDYWRAAMDLPALDQAGLRPLQADLERAVRLDDAKSPAAVGELSGRLELGYNGSPLLNAASMEDARDSKTHLLVLLPGVQTLAQNEYLQPEAQALRDLYLGHVEAMFRAAGDEPAAAVEAARTVLSIETQLVSAQLTPIELRDPAKTYHKMTLDEAQALVPGLDLRAQLEALGTRPPPTVQVLDLGGLKALQQVLAERPVAELRTLLRWHVLGRRAAALGQPWRGLDEAFTRQRQGLKITPARERLVTQAIAAQLFHPLSQLYVAAYFPETTRREIVDMVGHIRAEFEQRLRVNPWLDAPTRAAALEKLARVDVQVGRPKEWIDFSRVIVRPDDHFGNVQRIDAFLVQRDLAKVGQQLPAERFAAPGMTTPIAVNAAYNPATNSIDITAAIAQPPFYKAGADPAVNYCTMGAVIGHELTHGFDSFGRQFDPDGNLRDWWTAAAAGAFRQRTDVLVAQYSGFTLLPGVQHDGALTLTENTADLGGITLAHAALHRAVAGRPQPRIDGLTTDQRCFVAWAQMWAYKARPERVRLLAKVDYHANSVLRGVAPLQHLDAFHRAFGIRRGDPMWRAPAQRVVIW